MVKKWTYARTALLFESCFEGCSPQEGNRRWLEALVETGWTDEEFLDKLEAMTT